MRRRRETLPRIGPCNDPLFLWFLEYIEGTTIYRRYFANRREARTALTAYRDQQKAAPPRDEETTPWGV